MFLVNAARTIGISHDIDTQDNESCLLPACSFDSGIKQAEIGSQVRAIVIGQLRLRWVPSLQWVHRSVTLRSARFCRGRLSSSGIKERCYTTIVRHTDQCEFQEPRPTSGYVAHAINYKPELDVVGDCLLSSIVMLDDGRHYRSSSDYRGSCRKQLEREYQCETPARRSERGHTIGFGLLAVGAASAGPDEAVPVVLVTEQVRVDRRVERGIIELER